MEKRIVVAAAVLWLGATQASANYINGYAVANHRSCGASNLPATITELERFYASRYFPEDMQKNFLWTDSKVAARDWGAAADFYDSTSTANGSDGVDSGFISYIASHGMTSSARYTGLAGGGSAGCNIRNGDMGIGDNNARYLVLSTCEGVKIGTGENPTRPGENPSTTWRSGNKGLNCIFGYSNNMVDASQYGEYLLENLATTDETLASAFMRAARRVSYSNVPAVLCFGTDEANARQHLDTAKKFTDDRYGDAASAWTYTRSLKLERAFSLAGRKSGQPIPKIIRSPHVDVVSEKVITSLLGKDVKDYSVRADLLITGSAAGIVTRDPRTGFFSWRKELRNATESKASRESGEQVQLKDESLIQISKDFLSRNGILKEIPGDLQATYILERGTSTPTGIDVAERTVVFHQKFHGLTTLQSAGSIEVTVTAAGEVVSLSGSVIQPGLLRVTEWLDAEQVDMDAAAARAVEGLKAQMPEAELAVVDVRIGYDTGDYSSAQDRSRVVAEVLVEAAQGGFKRRHIQKVPL